jgi:hypothetical protein
MTANHKPTGRDITLAFEKLGGVAGLVKWAKANSRNKAQFYSMFAKSIMETSGAHVESADPQALASVLRHALLGAVNAARGDPRVAVVTPIGASGGGKCVDWRGPAVRTTNIDGADHDVTTPDHGLRDTPHHGMEETLAAQPKLTQQKSHIENSKPSSRRAAEPIIGLNAAAALGVGSPGKDATQLYIEWVNNGGTPSY